MPAITVFSFKSIPKTEEIVRILKSKRFGESWINARMGNFNSSEIFIQYWYYEDLEEALRKLFIEETSDIVSYLKQGGKEKVLKRIYCFLNMDTKTLEIYRWFDQKTAEIVGHISKLLKTEFIQIQLSSDQLVKIFSENSEELNQAMFKDVEGLMYEIMRGNRLSENKKFINYLKSFPSNLRVITFRPKIRFANGNGRYFVTINGDKGMIRISSNGYFSWRPRYEVRQLVYILARTAGLVKLNA